MRRITLFALLILSAVTARLGAQNVMVSGALVGNGLYPDLGTAFTAINSGSQTGANIIIAVLGNTTEAATATLNAGTWNSISMVPSGGGARTISGTIAGALVNFNGADLVGIDGLNSGGNSLTFDNASTGTASTIQFSNDAHLIAIQNTTIRGANTSITSGTVFLTSGTTTGNDSITLNACTIDASGANFPVNGIYSAGLAAAGQENSVIAINNCNIANFFSATQVSCGILAATGNTDWTIQGNRFYQGATRTYTTGNIHRAIQVSSGNNHTIATNIIGYATSAQTGTYTMAGTIATRFIGIDLAVGTTIASSVQGNTVTAIALATSSGASTTNGIIAGINVTAGNVNIGNTAANIIGGAIGTNLIVATPTTSNGMVVGINSSSTGTILIQNNVIGGLTSSGSTAAISGNVTGINVSGVAASMTINSNIIGNTQADNMRGGTNGLTTGSSVVIGINLPSTSLGTINVTNNTIRNLASYGTGTTGAVRGIMTAAATGSTSVYNIANNTISTLATNSSNTSISSGQASACGINISVGNNGTVTGNSISNISQLGTGAVGTYAVGITHGNATNTTISGNTIYGVTNAGTSVTTTAPSIAAGIVIRSGTTAVNVRNNMISIGSAAADQAAYLGIMANHGSTPDPVDNIIHNTINIYGTSSNLQPSFGFARTDFSTAARTPTVVFVNNIVTNTRSGGTGAHVAIANNYNSTTPTTTGWGANASNNNVLNAASAASIGWWGSAQTFAGWQAVSAGDAASYSGITVTYVNSLSNLHLNMGVTPTPMESGGQTTVVTTDIDNQTRPGPVGSVNGGAFAPDLGADEFDGVYQDLQKPAITYTPLTFICATTDRTVTATITDYSGVPTTGSFMPRIYFRKNAAGWVSAAGVLASGNATNGTWNFTISTAAMGGLTTGDIVSYYIIAQDVATPSFNIGSNPATGLVATDVNTVTTPPTTPNSYSISGTLSGTYTVGASGAFPTVTAAVTAYNNSCLSGAVVFSLIDATYPSETFPITVNANPYASAVNTLTIKPATGVTATISGSSATAVIILNGADYVTIDGHNGTTANTVCPRATATRDLTISNTNTSTASAIVAFTTTSGGDAATHNTLMNCMIVGNASLTTGVAINLSGPTIGSGVGANGNNDNQIINNGIQQAQVGIFSAGASPTAKSRRNTYNLNDLNYTGTLSLGRFGLMLLYEDSCNVISNRVGNITNTGSTDVVGISLGSNAASNALTTSAETSNGIVRDNLVENLTQTGTFSAVGILVAATTSGTTTITNNIVNRAFCNGTGGDFACGIYYGGGAGQMNIYHNTVNITGTALTGATQPNMAIGINGTTPPVDIRNNILLCSGSNGFNGNTGIGLAYTSTTGNYANLVSDYNDIFVAGTSSGVGRTGGLAAGIVRTTLNDWRTETGRDMNSVGIVPAFVSLADLHMVAGSNAGIEDGGTVIATVTDDYDCQTRDLCSPDIGADEFGTPREIDVQGNSISIADGDASPSTSDFTDFDSTSVCNGTVSRTFTILNGGTTALSISNVTITGANASDFSITTMPTSPVTPSGSTTFVVSFDPSAAGLRTATINITSNDCNEGAYDFAIQGLGTQIAVASIAQTDPTCNGGTNGDATVTTAGGMPVITYSWSSGGTAATETGLGAGSYTVTVTDANGCTATGTVTLTEPGAITTSMMQTNVSCNGGNNGDAMVMASGGTGTLTYSWSSGGTNASETNLAAGTYTVTVTDANSCTAIDSVTITEPLAITTSITANYPQCNGGTGDATINSTGGTGTHTYSWSSGGTNATESNLAAGTYTVTVTDANGCTAVDSITIVQPVAITASITSNSPLCNGGTGDATVSSSGGTGPHTYSWSSGGTGATETNLAAGTYTVTVTDSLGCTAIDSVTITEPTALTASSNTTVDPSTCGGNDGSIDITVSGGTAAYTYLWSNSNTNEDLTGLTAGMYSATVTDANFCTTTFSVTLNDPNPPVVSLAIAQDTACTLDGIFALTGGSPAGGAYSGTGVSAGNFNPASAVAGYNVITYTYTDPNTQCTGTNVDSIYVDPCAGIIDPVTAGNVSIYPNPSYGKFVIELPANAQVIIYDALGQIVSNTYMNAGRHDMSLEGNATGIYSVHVISGDQHEVIRLVKE